MRKPAPGAWVKINPRYAARLAERDLTTADALLELPGEVVSGHADRHVVRVDLPGWGCGLFLKRQHRVGWRERLRQRLAGFGWVSRCEREVRILRELEAKRLPAPAWIAVGGDGRGRAFLLVEELSELVELRSLLGDTALSQLDRCRLAVRLGEAVAELHAAGFSTPDLTAKHVFVHPVSLSPTLIDWQSSRFGRIPSPCERAESLAAFDASLPALQADARLRLRFLWAYCRVARRHGLDMPRFAVFARDVVRLAERQARRRSIRDQRQYAVTPSQRLVWLAGEAVCAIPEVAASWPSPAVCRPFYDEPPAAPHAVRLNDGRPAILTRFRTRDPLGQLLAVVRSRPWRSPGATVGRVLFHLERYGIPAPKLLAFGQRDTGPVTADSFALYEPPAGVPLRDRLLLQPLAERCDLLRQAGFLLRQLHDSGCHAGGHSPSFVADHTLTIAHPESLRITRRVRDRQRQAELAALLKQLALPRRTDRLRVVRGYFGTRPASPRILRRLLGGS